MSHNSRNSTSCKRSLNSNLVFTDAGPLVPSQLVARWTGTAIGTGTVLTQVTTTTVVSQTLIHICNEQKSGLDIVSFLYISPRYLYFDDSRVQSFV